MRFLLVSHRAAPFPGGTEVFVQAIAEAAQKAGHQAVILTGAHQGDLNGVRITDDRHVLRERFDLIVVHGANRGPPREVLAAAASLASPVLYMLVAHGAAQTDIVQLAACRFLGWSTALDRQAIALHGLEARMVQVRHGIVTAEAHGLPGFRARHGIAAERQMFLSCGGYWPNKRMRPLARLFERTPGDALLVTTGYDNRHNAMPRPGHRVLPLLLNDRAEVLSAMREADGYLMHSRHEGFGLVLLEAMVNETPWIAHATGGVAQLGAFGQTYRSDAELRGLLADFSPDPARIARARDHAIGAHDIRATLHDIEAAARHAAAEPSAPPARTIAWLRALRGAWRGA